MNKRSPPSLERGQRAGTGTLERETPPTTYRLKLRPSSPRVITPKGRTTCPYTISHIPGLGLALCKRVQASRHLLRRPPAIAIDTAALRWAEVEGALFARVEDTETGRAYLASLSTIRAKGLPVSRGFGPQVALPLYLWATEDPRQPALFAGVLR